MAKNQARIFNYPPDPDYVHVRTAENPQGDAIQIEFTSEKFVNVAFPTSSNGPVWTSISRGQQLDDLIDALTYYREEYRGK